MKRLLLICSILLIVEGLVAQTLTISSSGDTGTSGTNWSISDNTLTVTGTASITASVITDHLASAPRYGVINKGSFAKVSQNNDNANSLSTPLTGSSGILLAFALLYVLCKFIQVKKITAVRLNTRFTSNRRSVYKHLTVLIILLFWVIQAGAQISINTSSTSATVDSSGDPVIVTGSGNLLNTDVQSWLNSGKSVSVECTGDLTVSAAITKSDGSGSSTLTLKSGNTITVSQTIISSSGKLNIVLCSDNDGNGNGRVEIDNSINTNGGGLWAGGNYSTNGTGTNWIPYSGAAAITVGGGYAVTPTGVTDGIYFNLASSTTINSLGGNIALYGYSDSNNGSLGGRGVEMDTGGTMTTAGGSLTIVGITDQTFGNSYGVLIGAGAKVTTDAGSMSITGHNTSTDYDFLLANGSIGDGTQSGNITITANRPYFKSPSSSSTYFPTPVIQTTGILNFQPYESSYDQEFIWSGSLSGQNFVATQSSSNYTYMLDGLTINNLSSMGGITIGKTGNTQNVTISSALTVAGPIELYGSYVMATANMTSTATNQHVLLKGLNYSWLQSGACISTQGGDAILWANAGGSATNREAGLLDGSSITTNGGRIVIAGGADDGSNGGTAGDGIPDGYAYRTVNADYGAVTIGGVNVAGSTGVTLNSGGGDIIIRGQCSGLPAVITQGKFAINSGTGTVTIMGSGTTNGIEFCNTSPNWVIQSANTTANAITISGTTTGDGYQGITIGNTSSGNALIQATGTGGGININGTATTGYGVYSGGLTAQILSNSGPISLTGDVYLKANVYLGNRASATAVNGVTPAVTASGSNITLNGDVITFFNATDYINTTGTVTIQPYGTSFGTTLATANLSLGSSISGLTLGKSGNTANITIGSATSIAGPITVYGGAITQTGALSSTGANSMVTLSATGAVTQTGAITATSLALQNTGTFTLTTASNNVNYFAAGSSGLKTRNISFVDADGFEIGTVGSQNGVQSTGTVALKSLSGNITVSQAIATTSTSTDAIKVMADYDSAAGSVGDGNIIISGSPIFTTGTGGIAKLYSGTTSSSTGLTSLVGTANCRYLVDQNTSTFSPALVSGVYALFREGSTAGTAGSDQTICSGYRPANLTLTGYSGSIQWQQSSDNSTWTIIDGATTATLTFTQTLSSTTYYRAAVTSGNTLNSNSVLVTVNQPSFTPPTKTLADLAVTGMTGATIKWYDATSGGNTLTSTTAIVSGTTYYASQTVNGVESTSRLAIIANINATPCAPTGNATQTFSSGTTVAGLTATGSNIRWYTSASGGTYLDNTTPLTSGTTYYATQTVNCTESATRLAVTATVAVN